jgi:hypothetical protein
MQMTISGMHPNQSPIVRISAVRACFCYCLHLKTVDDFKSAGPFLSEMVDGLVAISTQFSCEVLALCLETLCVVLEVDNELTAKHESKITPLAIAILLKYAHGVLHESTELVSFSQSFLQITILSVWRKMCSKSWPTTLCVMLLLSSAFFPL